MELLEKWSTSKLRRFRMVFKFFFWIIFNAFSTKKIEKLDFSDASNGCTENHSFFFQTSWKDGFSKKIALEYDLSCIIGKDHVSLSRKYDLNLRRKMKDDLFQKNTRKYDIFFRSCEKKVFLKRAAPGHDLSCIILKDGIFFPEIRYFFLGQEASDDLSQEIHGNMIFSVYTYGYYKPGVTPPCQKKSRMLLPCKNTPKGD